jgi:hypothetical protein
MDSTALGRASWNASRKGIFTRIGKSLVPVRGYNRPSLVEFGSDPDDPSKAGMYCFWTAVLSVKGKNKIIGRAKVVMPPGDRFDRMLREAKARYIPKADRPAYQQLWERMGGGANVRYVRPSTSKEIERWMRAHENHRRFVCFQRVGLQYKEAA